MTPRTANMRSIFCSIFLALITGAVFGQSLNLTEDSQISVLTCGTGDELYSSFGHSAFRVQDPIRGIDVVYNYGTFDFDTPNFYLKFARGKLLYSLSRQRFENFLYTYQLENRWVKEQILDLGSEEKNQIFQFLENNYLPQNRDYKYDFLNENCSTKIPEVLKNVLGEDLAFRADHLKEELSFRELIQGYLHWNSWASLGIDLALGSVIDRKANAEEHMFLPYYVLYQINNTSYKENPILNRQRTILDLNNGNIVTFFTTSPLFWLLILLFFTLTITVIDFRNDTRSRWLDFTLFLVTGFVGLFVIFLWFFTDHTATADNFNILWAFPANAVIAFYLCKKGELKTWIPKYVKLLIGLIVLTIFFWITGIQQFPPLALVILLILGLRYSYLVYYFKAVYPLWVKEVWKVKSK